jgi:hypothetical protein
MINKNGTTAISAMDKGALLSVVFKMKAEPPYFVMACIFNGPPATIWRQALQMTPSNIIVEAVLDSTSPICLRRKKKRGYRVCSSGYAATDTS